jgi:hypothetical protein
MFSLVSRSKLINSELQDGSHGAYKIEYKGKDIIEERVLLVSYGKSKRLFRIADVSNGDVEDVSLYSLLLYDEAHISV